MARPMIPTFVGALRQRRWRRARNATLAALAIGALWLAADSFQAALRSAPYLTGWSLLGSVTVLAVFNVRKKLGLLPLGRAETWAQLHIYLGAVSIGAFALHAGLGWPDGGLEGWLTGLFGLTALSGVVGLALARTLPRRLTTRGQTALFERIPALIADLAEEVEELAARSMRETDSVAVALFHAERLSWYFAGPRDPLAHALGSERPLRSRLREVDGMRRYADPHQAALLDRIAGRIAVKYDLDHQFYHQALLRGWLFVHVPATYALLVAVAAHVVVVHAFRAAGS